MGLYAQPPLLQCHLMWPELSASPCPPHMPSTTKTLHWPFQHPIKEAGIVVNVTESTLLIVGCDEAPPAASPLPDRRWCVLHSYVTMCSCCLAFLGYEL